MRWIALLVLACACGKDKAKEPHWGYDGETGPEHWAELDPRWKIASKGKRQSPIDLGVAKPGNAGKLEFHYYRKYYSGNNRPLQPLYGRSVEVD